MTNFGPTLCRFVFRLVAAGIPMDILWPIGDDWNHLDVKSVLQREDVAPHWAKILDAIQDITWKEVVSCHQEKYGKQMSLSKAMSVIINQRLRAIGSVKAPIFTSNLCDGNDRYVLWNKLGPIGIEYAFGHPDGLNWKMTRLCTAVMPNELPMRNPCQMGILIVATESLRQCAKFDAKSNWELAVENLSIMRHWQAPILVLGIKNPQSFRMFDMGKGENPRSQIVFKSDE